MTTETAGLIVDLVPHVSGTMPLGGLTLMGSATVEISGEAWAEVDHSGALHVRRYNPEGRSEHVITYAAGTWRSYRPAR